MTTETLAKLPDADIIARVILHGDLSQLTPAQKTSYYNAVCASVGLNPLTKPFQYLKLSGKEVLYATRDATDQLRKIHGVSVKIASRDVIDDCYVVTAQATFPNGRCDESIGAVPIAGLRGDNKANALMKAETKAKRRVTLAICGLGMLDETEVETIPNVVTTPDAPDSFLDVTTGEAVPRADRPTPPEGYRYIDEYREEGGWYHVGFYGAKVDGSAEFFKTKLGKVGEAACLAYQEGVPVKVETKPNDKAGEEGWLNKVTRWKPAELAVHEAPVANGDIPF